MAARDDLPTYTSLEQLAGLVEGCEPIFVRWSLGPGVDLRSGASKDGLTGAALPGLSANPLRIEPWWHGQNQPTALWVARRLYDYSHLRREDGEGVHPWVLTGEEAGRGPDNEPLVVRVRPLAWIAESVIEDAEREVARQRGAWGPLSRPRRFPRGPGEDGGTGEDGGSAAGGGPARGGGPAHDG